MGVHQLFEFEADAGEFEKIWPFGFDNDIDITTVRGFIPCDRSKETDAYDAKRCLYDCRSSRASFRFIQ